MPQPEVKAPKSKIKVIDFIKSPVAGVIQYLTIKVYYYIKGAMKILNASVSVLALGLLFSLTASAEGWDKKVDCSALASKFDLANKSMSAPVQDKVIELKPTGGGYFNDLVARWTDGVAGFSEPHQASEI